MASTHSSVSSHDQLDAAEKQEPVPSSTVAPAPSPSAPAPTPAAGGPGPPPNGGTRAWLQVLGAFFLNFNTWGLLNTFGIFQSEYASGVLAGAASASAISWIGSLQAFLMLVVGVLCGRALDAGYFYADISVGVFLEIFGMMMTSLSTEYYQVILAQGVAVGIGAGMVFIPSVAIVGTYFTTRRSTAMGLAATGSSLGGIVYPVALKKLIGAVGFPWAVRAMAFIMLGTLAVAVAVMRPRLPPRKSGPLVDVDALRSPVFATWLLAVFFTFLGLYIPFFYVEQYARSIGVGDDLAFYLLIIMNAASVPGRIFPSMMADKVGNMSIMIPAVLLSGVVSLAWIRVKTQGALIAVAVVFGLTSGSIQAVLPANVAFLCPDLSKLGTSIGMTLFASGLGLLIGSPVAGAILGDQSSGDDEVWWGCLTWTGVTIVIGASILMVVRVMKVGFTLKKA
ncbi:putative monocarboxylate permease [Xylariomycetidae sp. FL0641]|nr:putative monocarboxylate permease [Xylariomycetidae sp. FL0641]